MKNIVLTGNPLSTQHIYLQRGKMRFMKKEARERKEQYQWEAKQQWRWKPLTGSIRIEIELYFGDRRKRDWDNFHKLTVDSLTGIVWEDDCQIREATVRLYYDKTSPRAVVYLTEF